MISKSTIKLINSLTQKKGRLKENFFLVEGDKNVAEVLKSAYSVENLFATNAFISENEQICRKAKFIFATDKTEIKKASLLKNPQNSLAICILPNQKETPNVLPKNLTIYLDGIQDPGNLGTIIRICDWFGIEQLLCSSDTVDLYNPKVIQASMGSFTRVNVLQISFDTLFEIANNNIIPVYGAFLNGENVYTQQFPEQAILILGNEGNGIRKEIENKIDKKISIPSFSKNREKAESLNVSVATAIFCSEFQRNIYH